MCFRPQRVLLMTGKRTRSLKNGGRSIKRLINKIGYGWAIYGLVFSSGFAGLTYQVLWMRQLGLLFGNTAHAASATLAAFFAGLALGSWVWGKRVERSTKPLLLYACLQVGIAVTALLYFVVFYVFYAVYPWFHQSVNEQTLRILFTFALSLFLVFPPAFCMGGSLPATSQILIRNRTMFGRVSAWLYGVNTLGAALGAACSVFVLVPAMGFSRTYVLAIMISLTVAGIAWHLSKRAEFTGATRDSEDSKTAGAAEQKSGKKGNPWKENKDNPGQRRWSTTIICFMSGFCFLSLEVLWTRLFAQVHSNSVYAFATILVVVLTCLAVGAFISSWLARLKLPSLPLLGLLTTTAGVALVLGPTLFMYSTDQLQPFSSLAPWWQYAPMVFYKGFAAIGIVVVILGTIFPFVMKSEEASASTPGRALGRLLALNTTGAILGSLLCGFVFLRVFGLWRTMQLIAAVYLIAGILIPSGRKGIGILCRSVSVLFLVLLATLFNPTSLPVVGADPRSPPEEVIEVWEGVDCTVSVVSTGGTSTAIKVNSVYKLGSTGAYNDQVNQARIPLYIFPQTQNIFFLGLGTGMTAGAALDPRFPEVEQIVSCELTPAVIEAAKKYMPPELTGGIFTDPRSRVLMQDGRHYLMTSKETFDMINSDLFLPYRRGAGSLYSLDHYRTARQRLKPGGVYVQWLPLYQLTELEFGIIARTMLKAFDQVTMWRNNFEPGSEIVALIGQEKSQAIQPSADGFNFQRIEPFPQQNLRPLQPGLFLPMNSLIIPFFYCGNLSAAKELFAEYPINTDDRPLIEYLAPRTFRKQSKDGIIFFVGPKISAMTDKILARCPVDEDPFLRDLSPSRRRLVLAGAAFHRARIEHVIGTPENCEKEWQEFVREWNHALDGTVPE